MQEDKKLKKAVIKTLVYSDIFDYPLTRHQIHKYLVESKESMESLFNTLQSMASKDLIIKKERLFFLKGRVMICNLRAKREKAGREKFKIAARISSILSLIPTIEMIGLSGSLSMNNSDKNDDIDLFIVTSKNGLWTTRLFVNLALIFMKIKRARGDSLGVNKICPNMFVTISALSIPQKDRNLFSAHEVAQLKVLFNKNMTYERFINQNLWILKYLPNSVKKFSLKHEYKDRGHTFLMIIDRILFLLQYIYMKRKITREKISFNFALFHPQDKTEFVNYLYQARYQNYINFVSRRDGKQPQTGQFLKPS